MIFVLGLKETIYRLAMANGVRWYGQVLRREDGHVLRMELDFDVGGQEKKGRQRGRGEKQVEEKSMMVGLIIEDDFVVQSGVFVLIRLLLG